MAVITREAARAVDDYCKQVKEGVYSMPSDLACRGISQLIDQSAEKIYFRVEHLFEETQRFQRAVKELEDAPINCGGFKKPKTIVLRGLTPLEQTAAVCSWVKANSSTIYKSHTIAVPQIDSQGSQEIVPIWVRKSKGVAPSVMTTLVGYSSGGPDVRAPSYTRKKEKDPDYCCWDEVDPKTGLQRRFIDPLNSLEMHRRPSCIGAILLKANPYERGTIENDWRYRVYEAKPEFAKEASVEVPDQKSSKAKAIREQSAGHNLARMIGTRILKKKNLLPELRYEDYRGEDYYDDAEPFTSPMSIVKTFKSALKGNTDSLDLEMSKLFATRLGFSTVPVVRDFAAEALFPA